MKMPWPARENAIEAFRRSSSQQVAEHDGPGFAAGCALNLVGNSVGYSTEADLFRRVFENFANGNVAAHGLRTLGDYDDRIFFAGMVKVDVEFPVAWPRRTRCPLRIA